MWWSAIETHKHAIYGQGAKECKVDTTLFTTLNGRTAYIGCRSLPMTCPIIIQRVVQTTRIISLPRHPIPEFRTTIQVKARCLRTRATLQPSSMHPLWSKPQFPREDLREEGTKTPCSSPKWLSPHFLGPSMHLALLLRTLVWSHLGPVTIAHTH